MGPSAGDEKEFPAGTALRTGGESLRRRNLAESLSGTKIPVCLFQSLGAPTSHLQGVDYWTVAPLGSHGHAGARDSVVEESKKQR